MRLWKEAGVELERPFLRMPFDESMAKYGNDKPDLRFDMPHVVLTDLVRQHDGGGLPLPRSEGEGDREGDAPRLGEPLPHRDRQARGVREGHGREGLARAKIGEGGEWTQSPFAKTITPALRQAINAACAAEPGDLLLFQFGKESVVHTVMANSACTSRSAWGSSRSTAPRQVALPLGREPAALRVRRGLGQWAAAHHAFTRPHDSDVQYLETDPGR